MGTRRTRNEKIDKVTPEMQERIAKLSLRGMSGEAIARELGGVIAERTVYKWLERMKAEHLERAREATDERIARHHAQLDYWIEEAAWSFFQSRKAEPIKVIGLDGKMTLEDGPGDPRFLVVIATFHDRRAKLLGTDKAPEPPSPFIANPLRESDMTLEQAAELMQMSGAQLMDLSARTRRELAEAKAKKLAERLGTT